MQEQNTPPAGYKWIEYAENKGNSYVLLPYGFDVTDAIEIKGNMTNGFGDKYMVAPRVWNNDHNRFAMIGGISRQYVFSLGDQGTPNAKLVPGIPEDTVVRTYKYIEKKFYVLGTESVADMTEIYFGTTTEPLMLFYGYNGSTKGRIYYFKQTKQNGTKINVVPIQNVSTGVVEMYDVISKTIMPRTRTLYAPEE